MILPDASLLPASLPFAYILCRADIVCLPVITAQALLCAIANSD